MEPNLDAPLTPNSSSVSVADLFSALVFSRPAARTAVDVSGSDIENLVLPYGAWVFHPRARPP